VDPQTGARLDSVSLAVLGDSADGLCEMHRMLLRGDSLFIEVQRLDRRGFLWTPVPPSYLAVVDIASNTLVDADPAAPGVQGIPLEGTNPDAPMQEDPATGDLLVPEAGANGVEDAGGVERVDPAEWRSRGFMVTESALGGDLVDFTLYSDTLGFAIVSQTGYNTVLAAFDPSTGVRTRTLYNPGGYALLDCLARPSGVLLVADRGDSAGVRLFDARSGDRIGSPLSTGLPPFELVLMDSPAPAPEAASWLAPPVPNPTAGAVQVRWEGPARPASLEVFDSAGRLVRRLDWPQSGPPSAVWDGEDREGHRVGSGIYRLRAAGSGGGTVTRPVCVLR
jgi:hypothetical protein